VRLRSSAFSDGTATRDALPVTAKTCRRHCSDLRLLVPGGSVVSQTSHSHTPVVKCSDQVDAIGIRPTERMTFASMACRQRLRSALTG